MIARALRLASRQLARLADAIDAPRVLERAALDAESVAFQKLMTANNEEVFERMYSSPDLLRHYLVDERLGFYRDVGRRVSDLTGLSGRPADVVDVGCGTGHLLVELRRLGFSGRLVGLDTATSARASVVGHNVGLEFVPGTIGEQAWENEFDLALCTEVLEHCERPDEIVQDIIRSLRSGGWAIITVPDGRKDTWDGHINFWSPESFKIFIDKFGQETVYQYFDNTNFAGMKVRK